MIKVKTNNSVVGIYKIKEPKYPEDSPYHPSTRYPEYLYPSYISSKPNHVYEGVRELFHQLDYDSANWDTPNWNPLKDFIKPGMNILIKPNFVLSFHQKKDNLYSIITHPSVIRAVADYCQIALKDKGNIIVADSPQYNCNFEQLLSATNLNSIADFINRESKCKIEILDLRDYWSKSRHFPSLCRELDGDPCGDILINLKKESAFFNYPNPEKYYDAVYHREETIKHHTGEKQEYRISGTIFNADFIIFIPKLKVHKKVGVTLTLKGLVGMVTNKNYLPHYTLGEPCEGGDQFPEDILTDRQRKVIKFERWMYDHFLAKRKRFYEYLHRLIYGFFYLKIFSHFGLKIPEEVRLLDAGNWFGNDTAWRMVTDLAKIVHFVDKNGKIHNNRQRNILSIIDGVIGGENNGPLIPDPKPAGLLIGGTDILAVDIVGTRMMGFNSLKLKQFSELDPNYDFGSRNIEEIILKTNDINFQDLTISNGNRFFNFKPHPGWKDHIEI